MPFNTLLLTSLVPGTSVTESGVTVNVKPKAGETVLFFRIDVDHVRRDLGIQKDEPGCDFLVFYSRDERIVLCLLELKGSEIRHAVEQIAFTHQRLQTLLQKRPCWPHIRNITWKAYISCNAHSPMSLSKPYVEPLKQRFGKDNNFSIVRDKGKEDEFGQFLRK